MKARQSFGIIGYGRFGKLWAGELSKFGSVLVYDKYKKVNPENKKIISATLRQVAGSDMLFLLVPISEFASCCLEVKKNLLPNTLVIDAASVKIYPAKIMHKVFAKDQALISTHPLFGPDSVRRNGGTTAGLKIAVCPLRASPKQVGGFLNLLRKLKLKIILTTPREHDRQMASSQGLVHYIGRALAGIKLHPQKISTPDFDSLMNMADMVIHDSWQLFYDMQQFNPFARKVRKAFIKNQERLEAKIDYKARKLKPFRQQVTKIDAEILEKLGERFALARKIGQLKRRTGRGILDRQREKQLNKTYRLLSFKNRLNPNFAKKLFFLILNESKKLQK